MRSRYIKGKANINNFTNNTQYIYGIYKGITP